MSTNQTATNAAILSALQAISARLDALEAPKAKAKAAPATGTVDAPLYVKRAWCCNACGRDNFGSSGYGALTHSMSADGESCPRTSERDSGFGDAATIAGIIAKRASR